MNKHIKHIEEIFTEGYTLLPSIISSETCESLKSYLDSQSPEELNFNYFNGHNQIHLPKTNKDVPIEILFNHDIHNIVSNILGINNYYMYSYTCNANISDKHQPYHMDCSHFHPLHTIKNFGSPGPPVQLIVNTYLQDTNEDNGAFEIVPGSHLFSDFEIDDEGRIDEKYIKKSVKCNLPIGSVIIRDKRTWHRGTKNTTNKVRYMVGTSYTMKWYKQKYLYFNNDCYDLFNFNDCPFSTWNIKYEN